MTSGDTSVGSPPNWLVAHFPYESLRSPIKEREDADKQEDFIRTNDIGGKYSRIEAADTPRRVADEFSGMMLAKLDNDKAATLKVGKTRCNYSTGEVIDIVVGLL